MKTKTFSVASVNGPHEGDLSFDTIKFETGHFSHGYFENANAEWDEVFTCFAVFFRASVSLSYLSVLAGPIGGWRSRECESGPLSGSVSRESVRVWGQCILHRPLDKRGPFTISLHPLWGGHWQTDESLPWGRQVPQQKSSFTLANPPPPNQVQCPSFFFPSYLAVTPLLLNDLERLVTASWSCCEAEPRACLVWLSHKLIQIHRSL